MIKKTITFTDYNGVERTEDHYFNLNKTELLRMDYGMSGGMQSYLRRIIQANDYDSLMKIFEEFVRKAYGRKSDDGRRFMKSDEITNSFIETEAYDQLFWELFTDTDKAIEFFNGIVPNELSEKIDVDAVKNGSLPELLN